MILKRLTSGGWLLVLAALAGLTGCGDDSSAVTPSTPPVTSGAPVPSAAPAFSNSAAAPAAPTASPAPLPSPQPLPAPVAQNPAPYQPPGPPGSNQPNGAGAAAPPLLLLGPFIVPLGGPDLASIPGLGGPGAGPIPGQPFPPGGPPPGFQPGQPGFNPSGPVEHKPTTEIESYLGTEQFVVSADGKLLVTFRLDSSKRPVVYEMKMWNPATGKPLRTMDVSDNVSSMALSADGKLLATVVGAANNAELILWELPKGSKQGTHKWQGLGAPSFTHDASRIVAPMGKRGFAVLELESGKVTRKKVDNLAVTLVVAASPIEGVIAVGYGSKKRPPVEDKPSGGASSGAGKVTKKELDKLRQEAEARRQKKGKKVPGQNNGPGGPTAPGLEEDGEGVVEIRDAVSNKLRKRLVVTGAPSDLAFSSGGTTLAALAMGGQGVTWETATWSEQGKFGRLGGGGFNFNPQAKPDEQKDKAPESSALAISADGNWVALRQSPGNRAPADVWDTRAMGQSRPIEQTPTPANALGFLPDGTLVLAGREKPLRFFELLPTQVKEVYPPFRFR